MAPPPRPNAGISVEPGSSAGRLVAWAFTFTSVNLPKLLLSPEDRSVLDNLVKLVLD